MAKRNIVTLIWEYRLSRSLFFSGSLLGLFVALSMVACSTTTVDPSTPEAPLFNMIDAKVGIVYTSSVHTANVIAYPTPRVDFGKASIERFDQAFSSMFTQTIELPDWPPWRETRLSVDGVMEVELEEASIQKLAFKICLYDPDGTTIQCWKPASRPTSQSINVGQTISSALREVLARFMVEVENDTTVQDWAAGIRRSKGAP